MKELDVDWRKSGSRAANCGPQLKDREVNTQKLRCLPFGSPVEACQPYPLSGPLSQGMDTGLAELRHLLTGQTGTVFCYVVDTVQYRDAGFRQLGSGPNWQGGLITLCTCKHQMRSRLSCGEWETEWVAGFSGVSKVGYRAGNYLVYLMKIANAFDSHRDTW